jgi:hypothetical protein
MTHFKPTIVRPRNFDGQAEIERYLRDERQQARTRRLAIGMLAQLIGAVLTFYFWRGHGPALAVRASAGGPFLLFGAMCYTLWTAWQILWEQSDAQPAGVLSQHRHA